MKQIGQHAIVIGAGMGGLLAARALSEFYASVTVLERDAFPASDVPRKGVPQGRHAHGLLARGREVIEEFFPGWTDEVVAAGGRRGDMAGEVGWIGHGVALTSTSSELIGPLASRPVLEGHLRRRLLALPNVRAIENCAVQGLVATSDNAAIQGVRVKVGGGEEQVLLADLVLDASGRGSSSAAWIEGLGYARPEEERIEIGMGYTTRVYRRHAGDLGGKLALLVAGCGSNWRNGALLFQGEDRWIVSIGGYFGDHAPENEQMFAAYARSLPTSDFYDIVSRGEPLTDFVRYRYPANLRRRYERLTRFPKNYLVFGDAICSLNPVYGQGMTVSAQEALLLRDCLQAAGDADLARRFFKAVQSVVDVPWQIAIGNDLQHPQFKGQRGAMVKFINWYVSKLHIAASSDRKLVKTFLDIANLKARPERMLSPAIVLRVIWGNLARRWNAGAGAEASAPVRSSVSSLRTQRPITTG
jgi:2-polyprenyl-6-methoxyphenol hydroxylase-like FAD-dependent oxidoreductase